MTRIMINVASLLIVGTALVGCTSGQRSARWTDIPQTAEEISPLRVGEQLPDVELRKADESTVRLGDALKASPTVLIFYRGGWCPYCNLQLAELQNIEPDLKTLGYELLAISPDRPELIRAVADKEGLGYELLSDSDMAAARAFGIAFQVDDATLQKYKEYDIDLERASGKDHHLLPVPAVFLVDADGTIRFTYANPDYKIRIAPEELLKAAREFGAHDTKPEDERVGVGI